MRPGVWAVFCSGSRGVARSARRGGVAHEEIDLANPSSNHQNAGFTDEERNKIRGEEVILSDEGAKVITMVIPTNEELAIARETVRLVNDH